MFSGVKSALSTLILPLPSNKPVKQSIRVVFPAPEIPMIPIYSPFFIVKLMSFKHSLFCRMNMINFRLKFRL